VTIGLPTYNAASQITKRTHDNSAYLYADTPTYTRPYSVNGLNQYSQTGPAGSPTSIFGYDADGNLQTSTDTASNVTTTYSYDVENRLTGASGGLTATLSYDPNGRLYQTSGAGGTTRLLYDGDALVAEYSGSTLLRRYVHGPGIDEPLVWYEGSGVGSTNRRFLHADNEGSIIAVSDSGGNLLRTDTYDEYGIAGAANSSLANQRFAYTGQILIPELGLYHYKARAYSPVLGRFMQTDPVGYEDQVNLYAYVGDDPVNHSDPTGNNMLVIFEGPMSSNPFGHVAVAFSGKGIYSYGTATPMGSSPSAYISSQTSRRNQTIIEIPTTAAQDDAARKAIQKYMTDGKPYSILSGHTCVEAVNAAMDAAKLKDEVDPAQYNTATQDGPNLIGPSAVENRASLQDGRRIIEIPKGGPTPKAANEFEPSTPPKKPPEPCRKVGGQCDN
jgi:RHS repeat-associated protein